MSRYGMLIDVARCLGCQACMVACKAENAVGPDNWRLRVCEVAWGDASALQVEFVHSQCFHCENPLCVPVCPTGATDKDPATGLVRMDPEVCTGCKACVVACPYEARHIDPVGGYADKCSFCPQRLEEGLQPACVDVCPTGARVFGDLDDPRSPVSLAVAGQAGISVANPETGARPQVFFRNRQYTGGRAK